MSMSDPGTGNVTKLAGLVSSPNINMKNLLLILGVVIGLSWTSVSDAARILSVMSIPTPSHHIWFSSLPVALAERGHDVYSIDMMLPKKHPPKLNVTLLKPDPKLKSEISNLVRTFHTGTIMEKFNIFFRMSVATCEQILKDKAIQEIISPHFKLNFDVFIFDYAWHECLFGLIHRFNNTPTIVASPFPLPVPLLRQMGNPMFHALPHYFKHESLPMGFLQRMNALAMYFFDEYMYYTYEEPAMEKVMRKYFGEDVPPVRELAKHVALGLVNMVDTKPRIPLVASIIPVGGMHIEPVQPLKKDLQEFLDGAKEGAVIMSFGSILRGDEIGSDKVDAIFKVFSRLPQRLVWKYESAGDKNFGSVPPNVMLLSWLPQNDVLAHPNIRLFISHCGGLSTQEAVHHGVPILGSPFIIDQYTNMEQVVRSGMGLKLTLADLTEETLYGNVTELLNNPKYLETAQRTKSVIRDQQVSPLDRAVFSVEYVIRHRGAPHLRSPLLSLPLAHRTLVVDLVIIIAGLALALVGYVLLMAKVLRALCSGFKQPISTQVARTKKKN